MRAIVEHLERAERRVVETLRLRPVTLAPRFAHAEGLWKDATVRLTTRAYDGDAVEYMRVALVAGVQLAIGTLLVVPRPNRALALLDEEITWRGERITSELAAFDANVDAWIRRASQAEPDTERADDERARHHAFASARRADPRAASMLGAMFGRAWANDYVGKVLFPGD